MITDVQKRWLQQESEGKRKNVREQSSYRIRIRKRIDHMLENLVWLAKNRPDILHDVDYELTDETIPRYRRARTLLKAVALFENEPTVLSLIAEIYSEFQLEVSRK